MGLIEVAGDRRPKVGERACGDAWLHVERGSVAFLAIVDGLGHGVDAAHAAETALDLLRSRVPLQEQTPDLASLLCELHQELRGSRGVVAGLARIDSLAEVIDYVGVGNTEVRLVSDAPSHLYSRSGLIGDGRPLRPVVRQAHFPPGALLILHTDGVGPVALEKVPRSLSCAQIARLLIQKWARPDDDAAVVVVRCQEDP